LIRKGWVVVSQKGSHIKLRHPARGSYMFGFHDNEELGHAMLSRIAKHTWLTPDPVTTAYALAFGFRLSAFG
jgi:predicted RNA binding protein YcfA (HicA-like mRNA interferase family)